MAAEKTDRPKPQPLMEGIDFTIDALGHYVFTAAYLLRRGDCCGSKCRNCPYEWKNVPPTRRLAGEKLPPLDGR